MTRKSSGDDRKIEYIEARQRAVLEHVVDGIITIDEAGLMQDFNRAAETIFGYTADEVIGRNVRMLMPEPYMSEHDGYLQRYRDTGEAQVIGIGREVEGRRKDGSQFPLELAVSEMIVGDRRYFSGIVRDISERKRAERELIEARDIAEQSTRAKSDFLANMSHEIRTPMNAMINLAYLAQRDEIPVKTRDYLAKIEESGRNLLGIINDVLDFSKIEAGKLDLEEISFNLHKMLRQLATIFGYRALEKNVEVLFSTGADIPAHLIGDPLRLSQVLTNLISNGIKFTEKGEVVMTVSIAEKNGDNYLIRFEVADTGIGMTDEQMEHLFESFSQADGSISRKYGGTGLGLAISRYLVELMDGELQVRSAPREGSVFTFTIPLRESAEHADDQSQTLPGFQGLRVLIVDDNQAARVIAQETLSSFGFVADIAASGTEALEILRNTNRSKDEPKAFQVLLLDWRMPTMNGVETFRKIVSDPQIGHQPKAILCTAFGVEAVREEAEREGIDTILTKPFNNSTLLNAIATSLDLSDERIDTGPSPVVDDALINRLKQLSGRHILLVDDNEINQMIGVDLLESQNFNVTVAGSAQEAFDKLEAKHFDLILMDVQMPEMDGLDATRRLRKDSRFAKVPILAMTAHAMENDRQRSLAAGMNDHLTKPIDADALYRALAYWINGEIGIRINGGVESGNDDELPDSLPGINVQKGLSQLIGNRQLYFRLLKKFLEQYGSANEKLDELLSSNAIEDAIRMAHSIKSAGGSLGATGLFDAAHALEGELRAHGDEIEQKRQAFADALDEVLGGLQDFAGV